MRRLTGETALATMEKMFITGGRRLEGVVNVSGGKNTAVAIIPATLLSDEPCTVENLPDIEDVHVLVQMMCALGAKVDFDGTTLRVDPRGVDCWQAPQKLSCRMRASSYLLGVLLGRFGRAQVPLPGGCDIGPRPVDQHIKAMRAMGAEIEERFGVIHASAPEGMLGGDVYFDMVTVGGTINAMLAACRARGNTVIHNAAKEPHVVDLANFLNSMGARIKGAGTDVIRVRGQERLHGSTYAVIPDQIETGTLMIAAAASHGDVTITGCIPTHMESLSAKLLEMGAKVDERDDAIRVRSIGAHRAVNIKTQVYPGFPTDLQQPMTALLTTAKGTSLVTENIFEQRYKHLFEMQRMGAQVRVMDRVAVIEGTSALSGAPVYASDLRAGAALVIAGLMAEGVTEIGNVHFIDRGYEHLEQKLAALGAKIERAFVEL